jgi:hypothetical protein
MDPDKIKLEKEDLLKAKQYQEQLLREDKQKKLEKINNEFIKKQRRDVSWSFKY